MNRKVVFFSLFLVAISSAFLLPAASPASGADGTTGAVDFDMTTVNDKQLLLVHFTSLTGGADYLVNWTGDNTGLSFTVASTQSDYYVPIKFNYPASGQQITVYLRYQSAGTVIDQHTVTVIQTDTIIDDDQFLAIIVPVIIVVVLITIVIDMGRSRRE